MKKDNMTEMGKNNMLRKRWMLRATAHCAQGC